jgi:hypothetical protein
MYRRPPPRHNNSFVDLDVALLPGARKAGKAGGERGGAGGLEEHGGAAADSSVTRSPWPDFDGVPLRHCILGPGEMLYIPRHTWHYVRSLSVSFSASFWWGGERDMPPPSK